MENDSGSHISIRKPQKKLYYSLRQTAEMVGLTTEIIKNWEKEFSQLSPMRNRAGNRHYTEKDVLLLFKIKELLVEKKLAIPEAQAKLKNNNEQLEKDSLLQLKQTLAEVKMEVGEILNLLES